MSHLDGAASITAALANGAAALIWEDLHEDSSVGKTVLVGFNADVYSEVMGS